MVTKPRSPNYPTVDLETALELLQKLYDQVHRGEFTASDAADAWGYKSASGPLRSKLAALKQYGLIEGNRRGKHAENPCISRRGLTLVLQDQTTSEYQAELKKAALEPPLFEETYNSLSAPADGALRHHLIAEKKFTDGGAQRFIEVYRSTIQLANLNKDDELTRLEEDDSNEYEESETKGINPETVSVGSRKAMLAIPLSTKGEYAKLLPGMTSAEWKRIVTLFQAYRDTLVQDETESPDSI